MKAKVTATVMMNQKQSSSPSPIYNFAAGPACLPREVLQQIRDDIPDWHDGISIMEISHRSKVFMSLAEEIEANFRKILAIPDEFAVLLMHGGARTQFSAIPLNLLNGFATADYLITGHWSKLAYQDALKYGQVTCVASSEAEQYVNIPEPSNWEISKNSAYFHYADNETIHGVEFLSPPHIKNQWLVSDMTSNILTKPIDFSLYGLIYASAQKNLGIAGITIVIVRKELLGKAYPLTPLTLNYDITHKNNSMTNTPPIFCWYVLGLVIQWALKQGGCDAMTTLAQQKADMFYDVIDHSDFYSNPIFKAHRSRISIPFRLPSETLEALFVEKAAEHGLKMLKGHKIVGGCRACFYNAMPLAGVKTLVAFMKDFEKSHG
ncbi:MAG: 3-phosphoserine/phosphohydroxythreonine transaminase [Candidatus Berkiellales bacterium]